MMPHMATQIPANFFGGISSPNNRQPPVRIMTVCEHDTCCVKSTGMHMWNAANFV